MIGVSIDLETLGTRPYSAMIAVGARAFNPTERVLIDGPFEMALSLKDLTRLGARIDADTVLWWMQQSQEARSKLQPGAGVTLDYLLSAFGQWLTAVGWDKQSTVWGNGSGFDVNLMENLYELHGSEPPWRFWQARDVRTAVQLGGVNKKDVPRDGTHHSAADDATYQAQLVLLAMEAIAPCSA